MKNRKNLFVVAALTLAAASIGADAQDTSIARDNYLKYYNETPAVPSAAKEEAMEAYRAYFGRHGYREVSQATWQKAYPEAVAKLTADGRFADLRDADAGKAEKGNAANSGGSIMEAYNRIWYISEAFRGGRLNYEDDAETWRQLQKAIVHYGRLEAQRPNDEKRFHASCFAIPTAAMNTYFCHLSQMDAVELGQTDDKQLAEACEMLKMMGLQAWTQPFRHDATDEDVVQLDRFRHHVWWVGGNALGYRSLLPVAFMMRSIPMVDVVAEVCQKCISTTSQPTYESSFWNEGFTADGAGWGHGKQCLVWGYPIDGTSNALNQLSMLKGSPWEQRLTRENVEALMNYFRGSNFYYYKGYNLPCVDRYSMSYNPQKAAIRYQGMLGKLLTDWKDSFTPEELEEMRQLLAESKAMQIDMEGYDDYSGTRWFFNNDDLMKKTPAYHVTVNMASVRCDGLESAHTFADAYNYYVADGGTLYQKRGDEYRKAFGAFDVTAYPGVTAREGMERLRPLTNWRGYNSKYNFAAAATSGGANAAAGYVFEKMNPAEKENVNDVGNSLSQPDAVLYGVQAHKAYFMVGDYVVAWGAGVTNLTPEVKGRIRTWIEQTERTGNVFWHRTGQTEWLVQEGGFAYSVFPQYKDKLRYETATRPTRWTKMNPDNAKKKGLPKTVDVLSMWIDHGTNPVDDTYGYAVYCGEGLPAQAYPFEVLRNDTLVQAVRSTDGSVLGAVFYDGQTQLSAPDGTRLSVSAPCVVLIEKKDGKTLLSVTDARMDTSLDRITVSWNGREYVCPMHKGELCGKPSTLSL